MAGHFARGPSLRTINKFLAVFFFVLIHSIAASPLTSTRFTRTHSARSDIVTADVSIDSDVTDDPTTATLTTTNDHLKLALNETLMAGLAGEENDSIPRSTGYRAISYFGNWDIYGRNVQPSDVPTDLLTHVVYSFANVKKDTGEVFLSDTYADTEKHYPSDSWNDKGKNAYGCMKQFYLLKQQHRKMKVMMSIGGWTYAHEGKVFASIAKPSWISTFAKSSVQLLKDLGLDGLDIDWEYPENAKQAANYVKLLQAIRDEMSAYSATLPDTPHFLLSVAAPAGPINYKLLDVKGMDKLLDMWNLMTYDYSGAWDMQTGFAGHSSTIFPDKANPKATPFNSAEPLIYYLQKGVKAEKINLGMPLYGHSFMDTDGPGHNFTALGTGSWEAGIYDYKALPLPGAQVINDKSLLASWSYDPKTREMISFDTPETVLGKIDFIKANGLGGGMWWDASGDRPKDDPQSLIGLVVRGLGGGNGDGMEKTQNILNFPQSSYDNIKSGMQQ